MKRTPLMTSAIASAVLALSAGLALAQSTSGTQAAGGNTGSSATGGTTAPATQPGTGTRNTPTKDSKVARGDRKFIEKAAEDGMYEVQAAQLAATKATDPAVKEFASKLVDQHSAANSELTKLANTLGVEVAAAPPRSKRNEIEKLGKKTGADFDKEFVQQVGIKDHEKDIKEFRKASKDAKDPQLKAWVDKTLPTLEEHLASAQKLPAAGGKGNDAASMGNKGASTSTSPAYGSSPSKTGS